MSEINEDLRKWFREKWVRFDTKGNIKGDCAREPGEGKPKCLPQSKAHALGKKKRASAARRKRREDPHAGREGKAKFVKTHNEETIHEIRDVVKAAIIHSRQLKRNAKTLAKNPNLTTAQKIRYAVTHGGMKGQEAAEKIWDYPYNVTTPTSGALYTAAGALGSPALNIAKITARLKKRRKKMNEETLLEKNAPTNPKLWAQAKSFAKKKFKIYPSAYANSWASKWYKSKGGGWKTLNEDYEHEMARNEIRTAMRGIQRLMKHLEGEGELEAWVQSKLTKAADYIDTLADYMDSRDETVKEAYELISEAKKKMKEIPPTIRTLTPGSNPYADDSTSPSYVSTPGNPITEESKSALARRTRARRIVAGGAKGKERKEAIKTARKAQEEINSAKTPLFAGQKTRTVPKPKTPQLQNLSPKMKSSASNKTPPISYDEIRQSDFNAIERNDRSKLAWNVRRNAQNPLPTSSAPQKPRGLKPEFSDFGGVGAFKRYVKETPAHKFDTEFAKKLVAHEYNQTLIHPIWDDEAEKNLHRNNQLLKQINRVSMGKNPLTVGRRVLKKLGIMKEEGGAGDIGTTSLTNKYIEHTPGQLPLDAKKNKLSTIKNVVKEEILNEIRGEKRAIGIRKPYTARRRPGTKVKLNLARSKRFRALGTRGPVSPKKPRPTATVAGGLRHAAKFTKKATTQRKKSQQSMRSRSTARYALTRAARG